MTQEQKLKKIIEKAIKGGYPKASNFDYWDWGRVYEEGEYWEIIFSKPFLKAYFGESKTEWNEGAGRMELRDWKHYAKELVLEDDKINYLYKFI